VINTADPKEIAAAEAYEGLYVPSLFQQWAPRLLDALGVGPGDRILDIACGTGILGREALGRVAPSGFVAGVDPDRGMLALSRTLAPEVEWLEGTSEALPVPDDSFDAVANQFGMMYSPDRPQAVREMLRVLRPGGKMAIAVWDHLENSEAYPEAVEVLERLAGKAAADALKAPFVLGDKAELQALFEEAGVEDVRIETQHGTGRYPNARQMLEADLRGWLPVLGVHLSEEMIETILREAEVALKQYITDDGQVVFDSPAHVITGRASG